MAAAAAVIGTVNRDADALMTCKAASRPCTSGILTPDQNIYVVTVQIQPALQEADRGSELSVRPGVRRLMVPISQRLYRPTAPRNSNLLSLSLNTGICFSCSYARKRWPVCRSVGQYWLVTTHSVYVWSLVRLIRLCVVVCT